MIWWYDRFEPINWYQSFDLGMGERRMQLRADWRYIIEIELENFRIRMTKIIDEMFVKKDDVITDKEELEIKKLVGRFRGMNPTQL